MTPEDAPVVRRSLFPARVTLPDGTVHRLAKLVVTQERVYVFVLAQPTVATVYEAPYSDATLPRGYQPVTDLYRVTTADGELVAQRLTGCGCSARSLKSYRPFPNAPERVST